MQKIPKKFPYGMCQFCQNPIAIPGLDKYKCSRCGWRDYPKRWDWEISSTTNYKQYK